MQQCDCDDTTGHKTLAQLRSQLLARLFPADPLANPTTRTLSALRTDMLRLLGYGAVVSSPPPGTAEECDVWLNEAQQTLFRALELDKGGESAPVRMTADADATTLDYQPILTLAMAMCCAHKGKPEAKAYQAQHEKYLADIATRRPPGIETQLDSFLMEAHQTIYDRLGKAGVRTERWFTWTLVQGERFYDLPDNAEQSGDCTKLLNPRLITYVGVQRDSVTHKLVAGIPPEVLGYDMTGLPERYEVRQCIELWPAPDDSNATLIIKGHFQPAPFEADSDPTTVDDHAVYLLALANAKAYFRQPDAPTVMAQFEVQFQSLVAATHQTRRYIPNPRRRAVYVEPKPDVPFA